MSSPRSIVCVGCAGWRTELWTNQHHLMARFGATDRVLFVEPLDSRRPRPATGRDVTRTARRLRAGLRGPRVERTAWGDVHVLSPLVLPPGSAAGRRVNDRLLPRLVRGAMRDAGLAPRPVLWGSVPRAEDLVDALDPSLVVYHCVDDPAAREGIDADAFRAAEARFAARADLVVAGSRPLAERMRGLTASEVLEAPNVADTEAFSAALEFGPVDPAMAALPEPRIVFTGAIAAEKVDLELVRDLARARREWSIVLVGPVGLGNPGTDVSLLAGEPNVHLLGHRRYEELPAVLRGAAAGLVPHRRTRRTASVVPMKVVEYLAAGLPVVSTPLESLRGVEEVTVAGDGAATAAALDELLAADSPERRQARSEAVAGRSWDARMAELRAALDRAAGSSGR